MAREIDFLMWLFEQTREPAVRLDSLMNSFIASDSTVDDYEDLLVHIYGFEAPLEAALAYTPGVAHRCELRTRSGLVVHDLLALGMRPQQIAQLPQCAIAPFPDVSTAFGWLYVCERSRLQHPLLCARIKAQLPHVRRAVDFFCHDEIAVTKRWDQFASALEELADGQIAQHSIRVGARDAFDQAIDWFSDHKMRAVQ